MTTPSFTGVEDDTSHAQDFTLLTTKLYIPPPRPDLVPRPHLIQRLDAGLHGKLTLVSAPAGFGKTTLISEWVSGGAREVAWLSLDEGDNDPVRFLNYLIAALHQVDGSIGQSVQGVLASPQLPPLQSLVTALINDMGAVPAALTLVLDDYQLITATSVHDMLAFLVDHQPANTHLAVGTRQDPPLPLPRLRARSQVTEIREHDLRFTPQEVAAFLNQTMGLGLSPEAVAALEARTEGWIAGLQLAAISMQGRADVSDFIASFTGSNRYVLEYLVEEVLRQQPEEVQHFLLQTSILDRLTGPLCDALTGRDDGQATLDMLEGANLFIVPLDQDRRWYRYHRLFAESLRSRLSPPSVPPAGREEGVFPPTGGDTGGEIPTLHARASDWYQRHGLVAEAVKHALRGQDFQHAACLIEGAGRERVMRGESNTLLAWLEALPEAVIRSRPRLGLVHAWALVASGQPEDVEQLLQGAMEAASQDDLEIHAEAAAIRTLITVLKGDLERTITLSLQALEHLPADDLFLRGMITLNLGLAYDMQGDMAAAGQAYHQARAIGQASGDTMVSLMAITQLADLKALQGELREAASIYRQATQLASEPGKLMPVAGMAFTGMSRLLYERNDLEAAAEHLMPWVELGQQWEITDIQVMALIYLAQIRQVQGDLASARSLARQAEQAMQGQIVSAPTLNVAGAYLARLWLRLGDLEAVAGWAQEYQARPRQASGYARQIEGTTWARAMLALGQPEAAAKALDPLQAAAESAGQESNVVELLALQALALEARGRSEEALATLERALAMAEPEGYVRTFVDEGQPMAALLRRAASRGIAPTYVAKLLAAYKAGDQEPASSLPRPAPSPLIEPLSERELEVLSLLAEGYTNREMADKLVITVGTVKRHVSNIYAKLDVHSRTRAAARARELELL